MARYYEGPYWTREGGDQEQWTDYGRHYGWTDEDTRRLAHGHNEAWYWSEQQHRHVAVEDGITTTHDLAAHLAAGTGDEQLAAKFWVHAARLLHDNAFAKSQAVNAELGMDQRSRWELSATEMEALEAAEDHEDTALEVANRVTAIAEYGSEAAAEAAEDAYQRDLAEEQRVYDHLFDRGYYTEIQGDGQAEDSYSNHVYERAETLVALGYTVERLTALNAEAVEDLDRAWRQAAEITYTEHVIDCGNDGPPETDLALSVEDATRRDAAIALIAEQTGWSPGFIQQQTREAAYAHGRSHGGEGEPDYFAPHWEYLTAEAQAQAEHHAEFSGDEATGMTAAQLRGEAPDTWAARNPGAKWAPHEDVISRFESTAPRAAGSSAMSGSVAEELLDRLDQARAQLEAGDIPPEREHELAEYIEHLEESALAAAAAGGTAAGTESLIDVDSTDGVEARGPRGTFGAAIDKDAVAWDAAEPQVIDAAHERVMDAAGSVEITRAGVTIDSAGGLLAAEQAHAEAVAGLDALLHDGDGFDDASRLDPASVAPGELVGPDQSDEAYPQEYSVADDPYDYAFHHGGGDALPPVPTEFVTGRDDSASEGSYPTPGDAYRSGPAAASESPASHDDSLAEGHEGGASPGKARAADAVAEAHDVVQAELQRPVEEQAAPQLTTAQAAADNEGLGAAGSECDGVGC